MQASEVKQNGWAIQHVDRELKEDTLQRLGFSSLIGLDAKRKEQVLG